MRKLLSPVFVALAVASMCLLVSVPRSRAQEKKPHAAGRSTFLRKEKGMNRLILSIVVSFFCFLVAAPMPQQEPAKAQEKRKLTAEEKVLSWKGERVIFLKREGSILSSAGVVLPIYKCIGGKKFIVANGKVAQYVE